MKTTTTQRLALVLCLSRCSHLTLKSIHLLNGLLDCYSCHWCVLTRSLLCLLVDWDSSLPPSALPCPFFSLSSFIRLHNLMANKLCTHDDDDDVIDNATATHYWWESNDFFILESSLNVVRRCSHRMQNNFSFSNGHRSGTIILFLSDIATRPWYSW